MTTKSKKQSVAQPSATQTATLETKKWLIMGVICISALLLFVVMVTTTGVGNNSVFTDPVEAAYKELDVSQFSEKDEKLMTKDELSKYQKYKDKINAAYADRDADALTEIKDDWDSFASGVKANIEKQKQKKLKDWMASAKQSMSAATLFTLGTIVGDAELSGHTVVLSLQYNVNVDNDAARRSLDSIHSSLESFYESGLKSLKEAIDDAAIRIEYKNRNGDVFYSKTYN